MHLATILPPWSSVKCGGGTTTILQVVHTVLFVRDLTKVIDFWPSIARIKERQQ